MKAATLIDTENAPLFSSFSEIFDKNDTIEINKNQL